MKRSIVVLAAAAVAATATAPAQARIPPQWSSCKRVNARYPHGLGRLGAHDVTKSGDPVTNFLRSNRLYALAVKYNKRLDADKDGVACEKH